MSAFYPSINPSSSEPIPDENLHELRRAVFILAEQVGRIMTEKQLKAAENIKTPLSERFAEQVSLMGITDAIKTKKPVLKIVWVMVFVAAFTITAYMVYRVIDEYKSEPTATKVSRTDRFTE